MAPLNFREGPSAALAEAIGIEQDFCMKKPDRPSIPVIQGVIRVWVASRTNKLDAKQTTAAVVNPCAYPFSNKFLSDR